MVFAISTAGLAGLHVPLAPLVPYVTQAADALHASRELKQALID